MSEAVLLGDVVQINPSTILEKGAESVFISMDKLDPFSRKITAFERRAYKSGPKFINGDTLLARITPCLENGKTAYVDILKKDEVGAGSTEFIVLREKKNITNSDYIYYLSISPKFRDYAIQAMAGTSGRQRVQNEALSRYPLDLPSIEEQGNIGRHLRHLDEKIELNRQMNETLERMGRALFKRNFIDNSEVKTWKTRTLGEFFPVKTGKKDANFGTSDGEYAFFTCSQSVSKAPDYSFEGHALLLAGNGDFNLKLYRGKFEAYQRTYVLIPKEEDLLGYLYFLMSRFLGEITEGSRGSVIKFITKGMIENYKITAPNNEKLLKLSKPLNQITLNIEKNKEQISILEALRDTLVPRLISGTIKV